MKRECTYFYARPKNNFYRNFNRLENYEDYQKYMHGYDPEKRDEQLLEDKNQQKAFDRISRVIPLLNTERQHLIELCLKYDFRYKIIGQLMGASITYTRNEVKRAILDIKNIIHQGRNLGPNPKPVVVVKLQGKMTEGQEKVLRMRTERHYSFAAIAKELNLSQEDVHKEFMAAYKLMQLKHEQQLA